MLQRFINHRRTPPDSSINRRRRASTGAQQAPMPCIVGVPRSGTTLLRMMLDAHPDLAIPPETHFIPDIADRVSRERTPRSERQTFLNLLTAHDRWPEFHLDKDELRRAVKHPDDFDISDGLRSFYALYAQRFGKSRWGDKTPSYLEEMRVIARLLPEARFIHVIRDGRDVALSVHRLWFGPDTVRESASWWVERIEAGREQAREIPHYLEVRHEDLVTDTEAALRKICDFIELPWNPEMLEYHTRSEDRLQELTARNPRPRSGQEISAEQRLSIHAATTQPPMTSRVAVWKREMSPEDQAWFEGVAGHLLQSLGYETGGAGMMTMTPGEEPVRQCP